MKDMIHSIAPDDTFEAHVRRQLDEWNGADPSRYVGHDWCELSTEEELVFGIWRERFPTLACAMFAYDTFKDIAQVEDFGGPEVLEDVRRRFPQWAKPCVIDPAEFTAFAAHFCGLTAREAHAIYWKHDFWHARAGLSKFADEGKPECHPF